MLLPNKNADAGIFLAVIDLAMPREVGVSLYKGSASGGAEKSIFGPWVILIFERADS